MHSRCVAQGPPGSTVGTQTPSQASPARPKRSASQSESASISRHRTAAAASNVTVPAARAASTSTHGSGAAGWQWDWYVARRVSSPKYDSHSTNIPHRAVRYALWNASTLAPAPASHEVASGGAVSGAAASPSRPESVGIAESPLSTPPLQAIAQVASPAMMSRTQTMVPVIGVCEHLDT
jgi:hypothetical protein